MENANLTEKNSPFSTNFQVSDINWPPAGAPGGTGQPSKHALGEWDSRAQRRWGVSGVSPDTILIMYFMSEKAVGNDWKRRNVYTLRHGAGSKGCTYLELKRGKD